MIENEVTLIGRLVNDPKMFSTETGKSKTFFAVACGRKDKVEFISCTAWDKIAENLSSFKKKGDEIAVRGHLVNRSKEVNGRIEYYLELIVDEVKYIGSRKEEKPLQTADDLIEGLDASELPF